MGLRWAVLASALAGILLALVAVAIWGPSTSSVNLAAVLGAGLIDGLNPCAIAVLLIFVSAMLAAVERATRGSDAARRYVLVGGGSYVAGLYVTYFSLGVGLLGTIVFLQETHLVGRVAAVVAIILGLLSFQEGLVPEWGQRLVMPAMFHGTADRLARWVAPPALFLAGGLIGLCTIPCSGSVYLATVALLSQQATYLSGIFYLGLYNLMFVTPLLLLLAFASARPTYRLLARVQLRARGGLKLLLGATTVGIGLLTLAVM
ncbi:MAG: cytochrome c biogenesis CcdA family protein [Dehalococcoidia bacterium]